MEPLVGRPADVVQQPDDDRGDEGLEVGGADDVDGVSAGDEPGFPM